MQLVCFFFLKKYLSSVYLAMLISHYCCELDAISKRERHTMKLLALVCSCLVGWFSFSYVQAQEMPCRGS